MDFVVVGFGLGALAVLAGLVLRDAGPRWRRPLGTQPLGPSELARRVAWGRACRGGGRTLALGGGASCLATLLALAGGLDDRAGAGLVLAALIAATLGALAWCVLYARRYHPRPAPALARVSGGARRAAATATPRPTADVDGALAAAAFAPDRDRSPAGIGASTGRPIAEGIGRDGDAAGDVADGGERVAWAVPEAAHGPAPTAAATSAGALDPSAGLSPPARTAPLDGGEATSASGVVALSEPTVDGTAVDPCPDPDRLGIGGNGAPTLVPTGKAT